MSVYCRYLKQVFGQLSCSHPAGQRSAKGPAVLVLLPVVVMLACQSRHANAFTVYDTSSEGYGIGRWDAAPRYVFGRERSLDGGLRYSLQGGSYTALRDALTWSGDPPSDREFQAAVEQAFRTWETIDPASGLGTKLRFVPDFETVAVGEPLSDEIFSYDYLQPSHGAELDLLAYPLPQRLLGAVHGYADPNSNSVTLTSGVPDYPASVIAGVDIRMSSNYSWNLNKFEIVLTHEIGHALGLADVDYSAVRRQASDLTMFYDDNFDDTSPSTAARTLNNSFAALIDPFDPDNSPALGLYEVCPVVDPDDPWRCQGPNGIDASGVNIFMESSSRVRAGLKNDDYAGRQFLYPWVSVRGDVDADGEVTLADIDLLSAEINKSRPRTWFDVDGNGEVNSDDRWEWVHNVRQTSFGDANLDGAFSTSDLVLIMTRGKYDVDVLAGWADGDFDGNGWFDSGDLVYAFVDGAFEQELVQAVPEPTGGVIAAIGLLATLMRSRRERYRFCA